MDVVEKKEVVREYEPYHKKEYASKGLAGSALGLAIGALGLELLSPNGRGLFGLNGDSNACGGPTAFQSWEKACNDALAGQKALYDFALLSADARYRDRDRVNSEMFGLYKSQVDGDFGLYKNQRDQYDVLADRIGKLETAAAVNSAVEPWRSKVLQMQIDNVAGMVQLEAERRCCADNKIVNYTNSTFYPINVANVTVGTTSVTRQTSNPLCGCCDNM